MVEVLQKKAPGTISGNNPSSANCKLKSLLHPFQGLRVFLLLGKCPWRVAGRCFFCRFLICPGELAFGWGPGCSPESTAKLCRGAQPPTCFLLTAQQSDLGCTDSP